MKKLSSFNKVIFFFNIIAVVLTFIAYVLPFLAPKLFPFLSVLSLVLPLFLILNALFFIYWLLQLKKQLLVSGLILLLGITFLNKFYKFSSQESDESSSDITVMSYNVRLFNLFEWLDNKNVGSDILEFVYQQNSAAPGDDEKLLEIVRKVAKGEEVK